MTKSNYTHAKQCSKALWLRKNNPELAEISESTEERFRSGNIAAEYARKRMQNGVLVEFDKEISKMLTKTIKIKCKENLYIHKRAIEKKWKFELY